MSSLIAVPASVVITEAGRWIGPAALVWLGRSDCSPVLSCPLCPACACSCREGERVEGTVTVSGYSAVELVIACFISTLVGALITWVWYLTGGHRVREAEPAVKEPPTTGVGRGRVIHIS